MVYALPSYLVETSADISQALKTMRQNFMRRITTETQKLRRRETEGEDTDERRVILISILIDTANKSAVARARRAASYWHHLGRKSSGP